MRDKQRATERLARNLDLRAELDQLRQQVEKLEHDLAECYRLTGSDPDGDSDSMLAKHAVGAVRELREEADKAGDWEERAVSAGQRLAALLGYIAAHLDNGDCEDHLFFERADQVRKELEGNG
jgi:hypothetical protein